MTSPGLLLLLLVLSSFPVSSIAGKNTETKKWLKTTGRKIPDILGGLPVVGSYLGPIAKTALLFFPEEDKLKAILTEVKGQDSKFDTISAELKWTEYLTAINNVNYAWIKYSQMVDNKQITPGEKRKDFFLTFYSQYVDSSLILAHYLTAEPDTPALGDLLAQMLRCHEADVNQQFDDLNILLYIGNQLDKLYYEFKALGTGDRIKTGEDLARESAQALFMTRKECIVNINYYVAMDVFDLIDNAKDHGKLADEIMQFLNEIYIRYDWIVVAFSTHNSKDLPKFMKYHMLKGFIEIQRGFVTVAVAKQVKGSNAQPKEMKQAIDSCFPGSIIVCNEVINKLKNCNKKFQGVEVSKIYTAVHIYKHAKHTSVNAKPLPTDDQDLDDNLVVRSASPTNILPYLYTGKCDKPIGNFMILIKSDEEITAKNPCDKIKCKNGKCVSPDKMIAMCECPFPFFGELCEKNLREIKMSG